MEPSAFRAASVHFLHHTAASSKKKEKSRRRVCSFLDLGEKSVRETAGRIATYKWIHSTEWVLFCFVPALTKTRFCSALPLYERKRFFANGFGTYIVYRLKSGRNPSLIMV